MRDGEVISSGSNRTNFTRNVSAITVELSSDCSRSFSNYFVLQGTKHAEMVAFDKLFAECPTPQERHQVLRG